MGTVLKAENVSIRYITGDFKDIGLKEYTVRKLTKNYHVKEFMAVDGVSFELEDGDMLGIIGTNGAGKSTLLKAIAGIMEPTRGEITANGEIAALLELGSGFDGDLTVKENAYLRGAMLGYTKDFMDQTYDQIIDFAELRDFEHRPFKQLSSGMKSRLAFSIASLVEPDILILDEVLSVGDGAFQKKSEDKMREIISKGATTILVSHSLDQIREMSNKVLWLDHGRQIAFGETEKICDQYEEYLSTGVLPEREIDCVSPALENNSAICGDCGSTAPAVQQSERIRFLDFARAFAIISVVFGHSVESFYYMYQDRSILWGMLSGASRVFDMFGITFGRLGVPIFLFLTGALILNKKFEDGNDCLRFYKKSFLPLLITMEIWMILWNLYLMVYQTMGGETPVVTFEGVLRCLFFRKTVDTIMPAWYIPMIIGVYLFLPLVAVAINKLSLRAMVLPLTVAGLIFFVKPTVDLVLISNGLNPLESSILDIGFSGGIYGLYILTGYWVNSGILKKIPSAIIGGVGIITFGGCMALQYKLIEGGRPYKLEYNVFLLLVCCVCIFELFRRIPFSKARCSKVCTFLARTSLAIFFLHNPIQYSIYLSGLLAPLSRPMASALMFVMSFGLSTLFAWLLGFIRPIRRYVGIK